MRISQKTDFFVVCLPEKPVSDFMIRIILTVLACSFSLSLVAQNDALVRTTQPKSKKYEFHYVEGDPTPTLIYTLKNGLTVFLTPNPDLEEIHGEIGIRAGSANDPAERRGTAWLTANLIMNGTDRIGTKDFAAEKPILEEIQKKFETLSAAQPDEEKAAIYAEILPLSEKAYDLCLPGEHYRLVEAMLGTLEAPKVTRDGTRFSSKFNRAYLESWLKLESEIFRNPVFRLFGGTVNQQVTKLEDERYEPVNQGVQALYPGHPYGNKPPMGAFPDVQAPSPNAVRDFFKQFYAPNNMAIHLTGKFDPEEALKLVEKYFGFYQKRTVPHEELPQEDPNGHQAADFNGSAYPKVTLIYRAPADLQAELEAFSAILQVLQAPEMRHPFYEVMGGAEFETRVIPMRQECLFSISMKRNKNVDPMQVEPLCQQALDFLRNIEFDQNIVNIALSRQDFAQYKNSPMSLGGNPMEGFVNFREWQEAPAGRQRVRGMQVEQLAEVAGIVFTDNYVTVTAHSAEPNAYPKNLAENLPYSREAEGLSAYAREFLSGLGKTTPLVVETESRYTESKIRQKFNFQHIHAPASPAFQLVLRWETGFLHNPWLKNAADFWMSCGTGDVFPPVIQQRMWELNIDPNGTHWSLEVGEKQTHLKLEGMQRDLPQILRLISEKWNYAIPDQGDFARAKTALEADQKELPAVPPRFEAMSDLARYGEILPGRFKAEPGEIEEMKPGRLLAQFLKLNEEVHTVQYAGPMTADEVLILLENERDLPYELFPPAGPMEDEEKWKTPRVVFHGQAHPNFWVNFVIRIPDTDGKRLAQSVMLAELMDEAIWEDELKKVAPSLSPGSVLVSNNLFDGEFPAHPEFTVAFGVEPKDLLVALDKAKALFGKFPEVSDPALRTAANRAIYHLLSDDAGYFQRAMKGKKLGLPTGLGEAVYRNLNEWQEKNSLSDQANEFGSYLNEKGQTMILIDGPANRIKLKDLEVFGELMNITDQMLEVR